MSAGNVVYLIQDVESGCIYGALSDPYVTARAASVYRSRSVRLLECQVFATSEEWWASWSQRTDESGGGVTEMGRGGFGG